MQLRESRVLGAVCFRHGTCFCPLKQEGEADAMEIVRRARAGEEHFFCLRTTAGLFALGFVNLVAALNPQATWASRSRRPGI